MGGGGVEQRVDDLAVDELAPDVPAADGDGSRAGQAPPRLRRDAPPSNLGVACDDVTHLSAGGGDLVALVVDSGLRVVACALAHTNNSARVLYSSKVRLVALHQAPSKDRVELVALCVDGSLHKLALRTRGSSSGVPRPIPTDGVRLTRLACGDAHALAASADGLFSWGDGARGALGHADVADRAAPTALALPPPHDGWRIGALAAGGGASAVVAVRPRGGGDAAPLATAVLSWGAGEHLGHPPAAAADELSRCARAV